MGGRDKHPGHRAQEERASPWSTETPFVMSLLSKDTTAEWVHVHRGGRWNGAQVLEGMLVRQ